MLAPADMPTPSIDQPASRSTLCKLTGLGLAGLARLLAGECPLDCQSAGYMPEGILRKSYEPS